MRFILLAAADRYRRIPRAVTLRRLLPLTGDDEMIDNLFPKLAAMMSVEFVRSGQYTIVPASSEVS